MRIWKNAYADKFSKAPPRFREFPKAAPASQKISAARRFPQFVPHRPRAFLCGFCPALTPLLRGFGTPRLSATIITYFLSENNPLSENCFRRKKIFVISLDKQISL